MESDARPPQRLHNKGQWKFWKKEFQTYMKITKGHEKPGDEQVAWLKNFIGPVGMNAFEKMSFDNPKDEDNMEIVLRKLEEFFDPPKNEVEERMKFFSRSKKNNETIDAFIRELLEMSRSCNFGDQAEKLVRDAVVLDIKDKYLRKLIFEEKNLNLENLKIIYKTYEINAEKIKDVSKEIMTEKIEPERKSNEPTTSNVRTNFTKPCWRCAKRHAPRTCPAWGKNCVYCKQLHHFSMCCPIAKLDKVKLNPVSNTDNDQTKDFQKCSQQNFENKVSMKPSAPSASSPDLANKRQDSQQSCKQVYRGEENKTVKRSEMQMQGSSSANNIPPSYSSLYPNLQAGNSASQYNPNPCNINRPHYNSAQQSKRNDYRSSQKPKGKSESDCTIS